MCPLQNCLSSFIRASDSNYANFIVKSVGLRVRESDELDKYPSSTFPFWR